MAELTNALKRPSKDIDELQRCSRQEAKLREGRSTIQPKAQETANSENIPGKIPSAQEIDVNQKSNTINKDQKSRTDGLQFYRFDGAEKETDYIDADPAMTAVFDEGERFPAILPDYNFSRILQKAAAYQQESGEAQQTALEVEAPVNAFKSWADDQISRLRALRNAHRDLPDSERILARIGDELRGLYQQCGDARRDVVKAKKEAEEAQTRAHEAQATAAVALEQVFVGCGLLPKRSPAKAAFQLEVERRYALPQPGEPTDLSAAADGGANDVNERPGAAESALAMNQDLVAQVDARIVYQATKRRLKGTQKQFDDRKNFHEKEVQQWRQACTQSRNWPETVTQFDLRHLDRGRKLTRAVIEAEEAFKDAKVKAHELKVETKSVVRSDMCALDGVIDPADAGKYIDRSRVQRWIDGLPSKDPSQEDVSE